MRAIMADAWADDRMRALIRWVLMIPIQVFTWYSVIRFVGESIEAALWTWMVGFAFMMFTEKGK